MFVLGMLRFIKTTVLIYLHLIIYSMLLSCFANRKFGFYCSILVLDVYLLQF